MNLSLGQHWRQRQREQTYERGVGEEGEGGIYRESNIYTYTLPYVKWQPMGICWMTQGTQIGAM